MGYRMLDLFCGRWGWSRAFAARGWKCVGVDLVEPSEIPENCEFIQRDILKLNVGWIRAGKFDFICASSPCEQFSIHGMKMFHPEPPHPELGIKLFTHTQGICLYSGVPFVMENVRAAQTFVGDAVNHCGPFYLWGNAVPPLMPQGIIKGVKIGTGSQINKIPKAERAEFRRQFAALQASGKSAKRKKFTAKWATIPPELSSCVADYAERIVGCNA